MTLITPEQTASFYAAIGLAGEQPDDNLCDCGQPAMSCGLCPDCCGTDDDEETDRDRIDDR